MVTGVRSQSKLMPTVNDTRIFATKFNPNETESSIHRYVQEQIGVECSVEKIIARTKRHSSFLITASKVSEQALLDLNVWEEGVQVRQFYGRLRTTQDSPESVQH